MSNTTLPELGNTKVAKIIVEDTIRTAYAADSAESRVGLVTVQLCLAALEGEKGDFLTQKMMEAYLGEEAGGQPIFDARILRSKKVEVSAYGIKDQMTRQLQQFVEMPEEARRGMLQGLQKAGQEKKTGR